MAELPLEREDTQQQYRFLRLPVPRGELDTIVHGALAACVDICTEAWTRHDIEPNLIERVTTLQGAPAAMVFTSAAPLSRIGWLECGMFLQRLKLASQPLGLTVLPVNHIDEGEATLRDLVRMPHMRVIVGAVAVGYLDPDHPGCTSNERSGSVTVHFFLET